MKLTDLSFSYNGQQYVGFDFSALPLEVAKLAANAQIDQAADVARLAVLGDPLRALEYQTAADEAKVFAAANYVGAVPPSVQAWMDAARLEAQAATDGILAEASAWQGAMYAIRAERLKGKQAVLQATSHKEIEALADIAMTDVRDCIVGVGNAA
ncbi:hypothetical protein KC131_18740 [Pseudomonas sp. JQ170]|uniref:hypothetical protein n=1 Tax=unclassified Pseudomonas TaxID=196821 RepID=UPI00264D88B0|nr:MULTISPECIES: hypothetical protein [unclassified Pseudomonas]MDN7142689.1 hypothetical protein [Pseudomonas sp. JQ170]WRO77959.1 hypothetical protein U9R80_09905 [Pseudomonas sp. 170C]